MNSEHVCGPFVIEKMLLLFKRVNKMHLLLFIANFHVSIIVSFNPRTTHQPRHLNQCHPWTHWPPKSTTHLATSF